MLNTALTGWLEHMLLANPDDRIYLKVQSKKEFFFQQHGAVIAVKTRPHITVAKSKAKGSVGELLCDCIQKVCNLPYSFTVALKNYGSFPSHAVYINVHNAKPFGLLAQNLSVIESMMISPHECRITFLVDKPHMTIARGLDLEVYRRAIAEYKRFSFFDLFTINKLILLKRSGPYAKWQPVREFCFPTERTLFN
jgi:2'-5' RNA ligase